MKLIAITNVVIKALFIALIFVVIHQPEDYIYVPVFYTIGYGVAGIIALFFIFHKLSIPFSRPNKHAMIKYAKDSFSILATDIICTIKDKINYLLVGAYIGADSVVVYDLGLKLNTVLIQPYSIIKTVLFPRSAQTRNIQKIKTSIVAVFTITVVCVVLTEIFLQPIATFFIGDDTIDLLPIRLLLIAPIILSVSVPIASNVCIALGYNKYVFYSILVTTGAYVIVLAGLAITDQLNSILSFVLLALIAYLVELIYRLFVFRRIAKEEQLKQSNKDISFAQ
jgi:PST family polysaccharide transporter